MATNYPFSALFDYDKLMQEEEEKKNLLQGSQQKIMRTNALGDALRLISDAITGMKGATITPKQVNPAILSAAGRYDQLEDKYTDNSLKLRLADIAQKEKDLQYQLGLEAEQRKNLFDQQEKEKERIWRAQQDELQRKHQTDLQKAQAQAALNLERAKSANDIAEIQTKYAGEVEKILKKSQQDLGKVGGFLVARYDDPTKLEPLNRETIIGMFDDLKTYLKSKGKTYYLYPVLTEKNKGNISNDDLRKLIVEFPDFFGKRLPQLYGQAPQTQQTSYPYLDKYLNYKSAPQPYQQGKGPLRAYGNFQTPPKINTPAKQTTPNIIKPDKDGNTDLSELFK